MLVSGFITQIRREYHDLPEKHRDVKAGDGSSTVFKVKNAPIKEGSHSLYINNVERVASGYTLDLDTGDLVINSAPSNGHEARSQYQSVWFRDQHYLEMIQNAFYALGDEFYRVVLRSTSGLTLSANVHKYNCPSSCIGILEFLESDDYTASGNFRKPAVNWQYNRDQNQIVLGANPLKANYCEISYKRKLTVPTALNSALDVRDNWIQLLKLHVGAAQMRSIANRISKQGNASVEEGHFSVANLRTMANDNDVKFENLKRKLKPVSPSISIPYHINGGGDVM